MNEAYLKMQMAMLWPTNLINLKFFNLITKILILWQKDFYLSLYLFYNNNTWLQIGHAVIFLGCELVRNIFGQGKP